MRSRNEIRLAAMDVLTIEDTTENHGQTVR